MYTTSSLLLSSNLKQGCKWHVIMGCLMGHGCWATLVPWALCFLLLLQRKGLVQVLWHNCIS